MSTTGGKRPRPKADTLSARLVLMREELGWSQRKAAEMTGVKFGTWQGMEKGRRTMQLNKHIDKIADATGYDRDWLMWGGPLDPPSSSSFTPAGAPPTFADQRWSLDLVTL